MIKKLRKKTLLRGLGLFFLFFIPILPYVIKFRDYSISDNPKDWADFGSYIGGVYTLYVSVFAIFLTRHLNKKDAEWKKAKSAIGAIYDQMLLIDVSRIDFRNVSKFINLVHKNQLYIPSDLYTKLLELHDNYVEAKSNPSGFDKKLENKIKMRLKRLYDV